MEINEKLDIFYRAAIEAANGQSESMRQEYQAAYEKELAEYEKQKQKQQQMRERTVQEQVRKEVNREVSEQMVQIKKEYRSGQEQKEAELFALVEQKLREYRKTDAYIELLKLRIKEAVTYADGEEVTVYLDPEDAGMEAELKRETRCALTVGKESFGGGIRAVIPSKNIWMDESFERRLQEEKEKFSF